MFMTIVTGTFLKRCMPSKVVKEKGEKGYFIRPSVTPVKMDSSH